jgi:TP901 family phage tail tape measure protein
VKNLAFGIAIGLGVKGLADIKQTNISMKNLISLAKQTDAGFKGLSRTLAQYRVNLKEINALTEKQAALKGQLFNMKNLIMGGMIAMPFKIAIDFEAAMADVSKVVDFTDKEEEKLYAKRIQQMTRLVPMQAEQLAAIMASGGALGIAKDRLVDFTDTVAKMSFAFDMSAEEAGRSMATIMNVFELSVKEGGELGDAINKVSNTIGVRAADIVETMGRIGGNAKVFGLATKDAAALSGALLSLGRSPQIAATSINALLLKLSTAPRQGKEFQDALKAIGIDAETLKSTIEKNPQKALENFLSRLQKVKKSDQANIFSAIMGEGFSDDLALLVGSLGQYDKALDSVGDKANYVGSVQDEFSRKAATTAAKLQIMRNSIRENANTIGELFLPVLASVVQKITGAMQTISDFIQKHEMLTKVILGVVGGFVLLKTAVIAVMLVKTSLQLLSLKYWNTLIFGEIGIKAFTKALYTKVAALRVSSVATATAATATGGFGKAFAWLTTAVKVGARGISMAIRAIPIVGWIAMAIEAIIFLSDKFGGFGKLATWVWDKVKTALSWSPIGMIVKVWGAVFNWLGEKFEWVGNLIEGITEIFNKTIGKIKGFFSDIADFFGVGDDEEESEVTKNINHTTQNIEEATAGADYGGYYAQNIPVMQAVTSGGITVNINGNMAIGTRLDGKFDFSEFQAQLVQAVKESLKQEERNSINSRLGR